MLEFGNTDVFGDLDVQCQWSWQFWKHISVNLSGKSADKSFVKSGYERMENRMVAGGSVGSKEGFYRRD